LYIVGSGKVVTETWAVVQTLVEKHQIPVKTRAQTLTDTQFTQ